MKRIAIITIGLLINIFSITAMAGQAAAQQLSQLLKRYSTYQANFKQLTYNDQNKLIQSSHGKLMIKRPGKFRWETSAPTKQIVIANDNTLWVYNVDLMQATKKQLSSHQGIDPATLLSGDVSQLEHQFEVTQLPGKGQIFQLQARSKNSPFQSVQMQFHQNQLIFIKFKNNLGQTSQFTFSRIRINQQLNPNLFQFKPPRGVDVLKES